MAEEVDEWVPEKLERFHRRIAKFRDECAAVLRERAFGIWPLDPERGQRRLIFLVPDDAPEFLNFLNRRAKALIHLEDARRSFGGRLPKRFWIPSEASGCDDIRLKAYSASSVRPIDEAGAVRFMSRSGCMPRRGAWEYRIRSSTGNRYFAHVLTDRGRREVPLTEWSVFGVTDTFRGRSTPKIIRASDSIDVEGWGRANGWRWICGKGQSNLYVRRV